MTERSHQDVLDQDLRVLSPPMFNSQCVKCGLPKRLLPWLYVDSDSCWGPICDQCAMPILARSLRSKLQNRFSEGEFTITCLQQLGLESKRAAFLLEDLVKQGFVSAPKDRFCWPEDEPLVKRVFRRETPEEIFERCVKLTREIRRREGK